MKSADVEAGFIMLDRGGFMFLDVRSEQAYDDAHITKPPRKSVNIPYPCSDFVIKVQSKFPNKEAQILVACEDGQSQSVAAVKDMVTEGYINTVLVEGGWQAWSSIFSTSGRRKPPAGRWMSTGKEALKSGLDVGSAALTYEEGGAKDGVRLQP
mmetsp:Transcript_48415/g.92627  ORF Transcript_48415/g.92627 Transcript_48415/m.92627 type:complete len:154 (+) Transcript_48415:296-757(+)|eukprot:CAMPEP_0114227090 /NCGR_PEP_ID=MMETSP0058-20121206/1595_1 /TAXON_ID=36894 /ORGANISM="Pyramimonas parkeae, CCMP726" /LENGTH=153 /DNA_ID=CAMNT_0001337889 /DNA_START=281 /DNA_END=742 /DNA_ORIENTATION=-